MKLKMGNKVFLQKYELSNMMKKPECYPGSILDEAFRYKPFKALEYREDVEFKYVFEEPNNVKWLMKQDWIVDYRTISNHSLPYLVDMVRDSKRYHAIRVDRFNAMPGLYRKIFWWAYSRKFAREEFQIASILTMINYLNHKIEFVFPDGFDNTYKKRS